MMAAIAQAAKQRPRGRPGLALGLLLAVAPGAGSIGQTGEAGGSALPAPAPSGFEPVVQAQLREAQRAVARARAVAVSTEELGESVGALCELYLCYDLVAAAESCLEQARALDSTDFRWAYYQGVLYTLTGRPESARSSLLEARAAWDRGAGGAVSSRSREAVGLALRLRLAELDLELGALGPAEAAYRSLLALAPDSAGARFGLGRIAARRAELDDAVEHFAAALAGQPEGSLIHYHLGMAYRGRGEPDLARIELAKSRGEALVSSDPLVERVRALDRSREGWFARGVEALRAGEPALAAEAFRRVLAHRPHGQQAAEAHYNLGRALIALEDLPAAERELRAAIDGRPRFRQAYVNLAILLGRTGRGSEATELLERAVASDGDHLETRVLWSRALAGQGDLERARRELEAVLALDPAQDAAREPLAAILLELGEMEAAAVHFGRLIASRPDRAEARLGLASARLEGGELAAARQVLEEGLVAVPDALPLRHLLSRLLASCPESRLRDGERALRLAEQVMFEEPSPRHAETLAMALAEVGRFAEAVRWQERALAEMRGADGKVPAQSARRLERYRSRQPVRESWAPTERGIDDGRSGRGSERRP